jgi:malyl-CoA/(S)-citramalyl-CoA lyase
MLASGCAPRHVASANIKEGNSFMSFTIVGQATARLNRLELAVPGSSTKFLQKAAESAADMVFLDLEDAVAPDDKEQARKTLLKC